MLNGKLSFAIKSVVSGVRNVAADPVLTACSTEGKFSLTPAATKFMGIATGENVQFFNNIDAIEVAIDAKDETLLAECEEAGIDVDTIEGRKAVISKYGQWFIAKGHQMFDSKGNTLKSTLRMSDKDKEAFIASNVDEIISSNRDEFVSRLLLNEIISSPEEATNELLASVISTDDIDSPVVDKFNGARTSNVSKMQGTGLMLSFTDASTWTILKADLAEPKKVSRIFDVKLNEPLKIDVNNGYEMVVVTAYPIEFKSDEAPVDRSKK